MLLLLLLLLLLNHRPRPAPTAAVSARQAPCSAAAAASASPLPPTPQTTQATAVQPAVDQPTAVMPVYPVRPVDDVEPYTPGIQAQETHAIPPAQTASSFAPLAASSPPPGGPGTTQKKSSALVPALIAGGVLVALLLIGGGYALLRNSGSSKSANKISATPAADKQPISVPAQALADADDDASVTWANTRPTAATLRDTRASGTKLNTLASSQKTEYAAVTDAKREHQATIMGEVATAEAAFGSALAALPKKPETVTDAQLTAVTNALRDSRAAWATADAAKLPTPSSLRSTEANDPAPALRKFAADYVALRSFTGRLDSLINEASNGRGDLQAIFASVVACKTDPGTAATKLELDRGQPPDSARRDRLA